MAQFVVGIDTSLTENIQLGIFGNYGTIDLQQFASNNTGGGHATAVVFQLLGRQLLRLWRHRVLR